MDINDVDNHKQQYNMFNRLILALVVIVCTISISCCVAVCVTVKTSNDAMTEWFRLYMSGDYDVPDLDIQQSVEQRVGDN